MEISHTWSVYETRMVNWPVFYLTCLLKVLPGVMEVSTSFASHAENQSPGITEVFASLSFPSLTF
jgi:hypothetical protein